MNDMLSQEEIDALLSKNDVEEEEILSSEEIDALGEIGNISMGTSATALYTLLKSKVNITTPRVDITEPDRISREYPLPFIAVNVHFTQGIEGANLLLLQVKDAKIIADLMMGGDGTNPADTIEEIHLSAVSEAMNQMIGSASTSLATMLGDNISISPPQTFTVDLGSEEIDVDFFEKNNKLVRISFRMIIGDLIDSEIMQLLPVKFAKELVAGLIHKNHEYDQAGEVTDLEQIEREINLGKTKEEPVVVQYEQNEYDADEIIYKSLELVEGNRTENKILKQEDVKVQPVALRSFETESRSGEKRNIDLIRDVPLQVVVELGRTEKQIKEILQFVVGTIVELDKLAGEPVDIMVNGKFIAKGEVVVIDESFGVRITDIIHPSKRISSI